MTAQIGTTQPRSAGVPAAPFRGLVDASRGTELRTLVLLFFFWVMLKNAWLCEDSFITFRVSDNLIHGLGLRWNPLERVQVYTNPLWMLCVSVVYFVSRDIYFAAMASNLACSGLAVWYLLFRGLRSAEACVVAGVVLTLSKAFVDYSTSGLENSLSHLLVLLFFVECLKADGVRSFSRMVWFAGLTLVNRMDLIWLLLPALVYVARGYWRVRHLRLWAGLLPYLAWESFSLLYYGSLVPNTAYVKLATGVSALKMLAQGGSYFVNSLSWDPVTLFSIAALVWFGLRRWKIDKAASMLSLGVLLQLAYTARIGGDYMSGRMLSVPLIASLLLLSRVEFASTLEAVGVTAMVLALGVYAPRPPIQTSDKYAGLGSSPQGVDDERGYRHNDTSFLRVNKNYNLANAGGWVGDGIKAKIDGARVVVYKNIGYFGFYAGPGVHVIDPYGIGDPLLSRLPFDASSPWGPGHFKRTVPDGYPEAAVDEGTIRDPAIDAYWTKIKLVTRGPLFGRQRLLEIVRFNLGLNPPPAPSL